MRVAVDGQQRLDLSALKAANNGADLVFQVLSAIYKGRFVTRILAMSICAKPIVRTDAKKVGIDRNYLTVQLR